MSTHTLTMKEGVDLDQRISGEHPRILLIDDEPDNITLLKLMFQAKGFDVSGACSGKEALKKIHEVKPWRNSARSHWDRGSTAAIWSSPKGGMGENGINAVMTAA